jgi:N-acetylneuraminate epimerase
MNKFLVTLSIPFILMTTEVAAQGRLIKQVDWTLAAKLQNPDGSPSLGFAGAINGVNNNVLIVAGGANFPDKMPWEGGKKYYSKEIHVLHKRGNQFTWDAAVTDTLPEAIAYCGNTATALVVVYAGGENDKGLSKNAFMLNWDADQHKIVVKALPDLPFAVTNIALSHMGNVVYAIGGDQAKQSSNAAFKLDLNQACLQWETLPPLPVALANAVVVAQAGEIYVIGGRTKMASGISDLHETVFAYHPEKQTWRSCAAISDGKQITNFSAGAGVAIGKNLILLTGGDNGEVFHKIETYISNIAQTETPEEKARLTAAKNALSINHKGFYKAMLLYNTKNNTWNKIGDLPFPAQVTTAATKWGDDIVLSNGEVKPGVRTPNVMVGKIK